MRSTFVLMLCLSLVQLKALSADPSRDGVNGSKAAEEQERPKKEQPDAGRNAVTLRRNLPGTNEPPTLPVSALHAENLPDAKLEVLTDQQLEKLYGMRLDGEMDGTFRQFGNMFLVMSRLRLGTGIGLMTEDRKIKSAPLQSPFPESYHPTLREFLDAIALQTSSEWKYEATSKFFDSEIKSSEPIEGTAIFEFTKATREKPYKIKLAKKWKAVDKGNWVMYVPPRFPVGMDIYEMGVFSTDDKSKEAAFLERIRADVAFEWAQRVNQDSEKAELKPAKVGPYEALFYETPIVGTNKERFHWRHWVFMVGNRCFFVVSTIMPRLEADIFPDVEQMLDSFAVEEPSR